MKSGKYDDELNHHSWGEAVGISRALIFIANELAELNKTLKQMSKK